MSAPAQHPATQSAIHAAGQSAVQPIGYRTAHLAGEPANPPSDASLGSPSGSPPEPNASLPGPPTGASSPGIAQALLNTVLTRLAALFLLGAGGNPDAARDAARQMLASYHVQTEEELALVAEIISFSFHAMEALAQAAAPDLSLNQKLRLRGGAVSLSREGHKAQRRLDRLRRDRRTQAATGAAKPKAATKQPVVAQAAPNQLAPSQAVPNQATSGQPAPHPHPQPSAAPAQTPARHPDPQPIPSPTQPTATAPHLPLPPVPARPAIPLICVEDPNKTDLFAARLMQDILAEAARQKHPSQAADGTSSMAGADRRP